MLGPDDVGNRVVVRRLIPGRTGPSGGPLGGDVLGVLEDFGEEELLVRREDGELVAIPRSLVVGGKPVPPRPVAGVRVEPEQLQRVASAGWPPRTVQPLGGWLLREAGGFTGRANSALVAGRPDRPVPAALRAVQDFYARHVLPARAQVVVGSPGETELAAAGWVDQASDRAGVLVQVARVTRALRRAGPEDSRVRIGRELTEDWLELYARARGVDDAVVSAVLTGGERVGFAAIGTPAVAIGRGVRTGGWVGLSAVEVAPGHRRQGLGRAVVDALLRWAAQSGADSAYLQVTADNDAAVALYARYGFVTHHRYRYLVPG